MNIWKKLLLLFSTLFFLTLFVENFLFSASFSILNLKEVDDIAFQYSIRNIHESISHFKLDSLIKLNDYGYGWIFWIIVGLITYPFYLFDIITGICAPLIIMPRELSLLFTMGTAFLVYKSLSIYSKNEFLKFIAMLFLLSFPAFGYFAMRFGTVAQVMFFSSLTFYLAIRKNYYEKNDLKYIALAAAACVGTKLNGALILPIIGFLMADRLGWKFNEENLKKARYFLLNLFFFTILFSNPSLFLAPFKPEYFSSYVNSLKDNSHLAFQDNFLETMRNVVEIGYLNFFVAVVMLVLLPLNFFNKDHKKRDMIFIAFWLLISLCLLVKVMSMGSLYIVNYAVVVMYLIVFSILSLEKLKRIGEVIAILLLVIGFSLNYKNNYLGFYSDFKYFDLRQNPEIIAKIKAADEIKKLVSDPKDSDKKVNVLMDYRAIFPYAHLERENLNVQFAFDNLQIALKQIDGDFDYVSLNKTSPFFLSDQEFDDFVKKLKEELLITNQIESRKIAQNLIKNNRIGDVEYEILLDSNNIIFFRKKI